MRRYPVATCRRRYGAAQGAVALFSPVLLIVLIGGFAALAVDVGSYVRGRQQVENAVDAAALAGAQGLPDNGAMARDLAQQYAKLNGHDPNAPSLSPEKAATLGISFRCIVRGMNQLLDTAPDTVGIAIDCPQLTAASFRCDNNARLCVSPCNFDTGGNKCNSIVVDGSKFVPFYLAPVLGLLVPGVDLSGLSTHAIRGSACRGLCGASPTNDLDVVIILDRTNSLERAVPGIFEERVKPAIRAILQVFDPQHHYVALAVLPQSKSDNRCEAVPPEQMSQPGAGEWLPVHLSDDYEQLVQTIDCLQIAPPVQILHTNLEEPMKRARQELQDKGRLDVKKGIILFTDAVPDLSFKSPPRPCNDVVTEATLTKEAFASVGIDIFSIGFALVSEKQCYPQTEQSGPYVGTPATRVLADIASPPTDDNGCTAAENDDNDHFFCAPKKEDLEAAFRQVAQGLAGSGGIRLVQVPKGL